MNESMYEGMNEEVNLIPSWVLELFYPHLVSLQKWKPIISTTTGTYLQIQDWGRRWVGR